MALLEKAKQAIKGEPDKVELPDQIDQRLKRARSRTQAGAPNRNLCLRFWRGEQYHVVNEKNVLLSLPTVTYPGGKPGHRKRQSLNKIAPIVEGKVSASTQRVPSYEVNPTSFDPGKVAAASLAGKVAVYGYDQWRVRRATKKVVTLAIVAEEGFAMPFWDDTLGPLAQTPDGTVGLGDVRVRVFTRNQVGWEPGVEFDESRWFYVEQGMPPEKAQQLDGYLGGKLTPDAKSSGSPARKSDRQSDEANLVLVTDYFERPSPKYPQGRWITTANDRVIAGVTKGADDEYRPYPLLDHNGEVVDEPVLHRLSYTVDPDADQDLGLVRHLIDPQRSLNDAWSRILEWKNRALNPQLLAPVGSMVKRKDDTPGAVVYYRPVGGMPPPSWETVPPIPDSLFRVMDEAEKAMQDIASTNDIPSNIDAAKAISTFIEQQQVVWQGFIGDLAEFHSRLMRHCLYLVAQKYSEPRLLQIRGQVGWEPIQDFVGAKLLGQTDVRVFPGSIMALTRQAIQDRLTFLTTTFPGAISPEQAQAALEGGTAENLIRGYELDIARAWRIVQKIKAGPEFLFSGQMRMEYDPVLGQREVPAWMPRKQDNLAIHLQVFGDYMKTDDWDNQSQPIQEAFNLYYAGLEYLKLQKEQQAAQQQQAMAEGLGMQNAARPQLPPPMPSTPDSGITGQGGTPASASPVPG